LSDIKFVNPYDILEVGPEANETEIRKRFRMLSLLVHPDKCKHERAADAFHLLE
jgi:DnaJ family protein C protein 8